MGLLDSLKKIKLSKIVKTVKKTVSDATNIANGVATGGVAGGLQAVSSLKKGGSIPDATIYGSNAAAQAAGATNAVNQTGLPDKTKSNQTGLLLIGGGVLLLVILSRRR